MTRYSWYDIHTVKNAKSLFRALYISVGVFLFVLFRLGGALYTSFVGERALATLHTGIATDTAFLKEHGDAIAQDAEVQDDILNRDADRLLGFIREEQKKYALGPIGVADDQGIIVSRTKKIGIQGDNVFLTIPEGRVVSLGQSVENIGQSIINPQQMRISTGRPIEREGRMFGAVFTSFVMDDEYAQRFKGAYLPAGTEIIFYTKEFGPAGQSFKDPETKKLLDSYFNPSSSFVKDGESGRTVALHGGSDLYLVENVIFPSLEGEQVGALVFIPRRDASAMADLCIVIIALGTFILFGLWYHRRARGEERGWRYLLVFSIIAGIIFPLAFVALRLQHRDILKLARIPYTLYNSTLRLEPEFGIYDLDFEQRFSIMVDTGDESINAVEVRLLFDPEAVQVNAIEAATSTCTYVIEKKIDQAAGHADISCVLLKAQGERGSLPVAEISATPKRVGTFTLSFDPEETKVLASDGLGTNVLRMSQAGSYRADNFDLPDSPETAVDNGRSFVVFSPTHANQSRWYKTDKARFIWRGMPGAVYAYEFDNNPNTVPSKTHTLQGSEVTVPVPGDGVYYFHLQLTSGGPVAHYRIQTDRTAPTILSMDMSAPEVIAGDIVRFSFKAEDAGSGVQRNYYVDVGNHLFLPIGSELFVPFLEPGEKKVVLRVYDGAGNYAEQSRVIHVDAAP